MGSAPWASFCPGKIRPAGYFLEGGGWWYWGDSRYSRQELANLNLVDVEDEICLLHGKERHYYIN